MNNFFLKTSKCKYLKLFHCRERLSDYRDLKSLACKLIVFHNRLLEACPFVILLQPVSVHDASFAEANVDRGALIAGWLSGYAHGNFQVSALQLSLLLHINVTL